MFAEQRDMKVPPGLVPRCPVCGKPMTMNLRADDTFVQDGGWHAAARRYEDFIQCHKDCAIIYLELGVGMNTPGIIKYNFWQQVCRNPNASYVCIRACLKIVNTPNRRAFFRRAALLCLARRKNSLPLGILPIFKRRLTAGRRMPREKSEGEVFAWMRI